MSIKSTLSRIVSLKVLLIVCFIVLMIISGFLGYILTSLQSQKSMNELAENNVFDLVHSVIVLIQHTLAEGHQMNVFENSHAQAMNITLDNWVNVWQFFRPLTISNLRTASTLFYYSGVMWHGMHALAINIEEGTVSMVNFNNSICDDSINFPNSNCSIFGAEIYLMNPATMKVNFTTPLITNYFVNVSELIDWKTGPIARTGNDWRSTPTDRFSLGYSAVFAVPKLQGPPDLFIQCNAALLDRDGKCVGLNGKNLLLTFLGEYLANITRSNKILVNNGRAFTFEIMNGFMTGASHGGVNGRTLDLDVERISPQQSSDAIIAEAGRKLIPSLKGRDTKSFKVNFQTNGKSFICACEPLIDQYGLAWMAAVVLSLTDLFREMNSAAMQMLGWTALCILVLSILAGLTISFLVTRPLHRLSYEMEAVSEMNLENIDDKRSFFYEISTMQGFFHKMVSNLKDFRTFLPNAILDTGNRGMDGNRTLSQGRKYHESRYREGAHQPHALTTDTLGRASTVDGAKVAGDDDREISSESSYSDPQHNSNNSYPQSSPHHPSSHHVLGLGRRRSLSRQVGVLTRRMVSVLQIDIKDFHQLLVNEALLMATHSTIMQKIQEIVDSNNGSSSPIMGDKLTVFWNVKSVKAEHPFLCLTAALAIHNAFSPPITSSPTSPSLSPKFSGEETGAIIQNDNKALNDPSMCPVRMACTLGLASFGTLGTKTARAFTVISPCVARGALLQKLSKLLPVKVICDGVMHERIQYDFDTRLVALTGQRINFENSPSVSSIPPSSSGSSGLQSASEHHVYEVMGLKDTGASPRDEWMYELQGREAQQSKEIVFASMVRELFHGSLANARRHLESYGMHYPREQKQDVLVRWFNAHADDLQQLVHSKWGFTIPMEILASSPSTASISPPAGIANVSIAGVTDASKSLLGSPAVVQVSGGSIILPSN